MKGLSSKDMFRFSYIVETEWQNKNVIEKIIYGRKKVSGHRNDTETDMVHMKIF